MEFVGARANPVAPGSPKSASLLSPPCFSLRFACEKKNKKSPTMADMIKRRRGPAPLPESDKRTKRLSVFFNAAEYQRLCDEARLAGITPSDLMRLKFIDGPPPATALVVPELNLEAWRRLAAAAGNLNQIAKHLNWGEELHIPEIIETLTEFRTSLLEAQPVEVGR